MGAGIHCFVRTSGFVYIGGLSVTRTLVCSASSMLYETLTARADSSQVCLFGLSRVVRCHVRKGGG